MTEMEQLVRQCLVQALEGDSPNPADIDLDRGLFDYYGLTSLSMVMLMTSICDQSGVALTNFTEDDIAGIKRPRDIIGAFERARAVGGERALA